MDLGVFRGLQDVLAQLELGGVLGFDGSVEDLVEVLFGDVLGVSLVRCQVGGQG